jgi:hypothetical protein
VKRFRKNNRGSLRRGGEKRASLCPCLDDIQRRCRVKIKENKAKNNKKTDNNTDEKEK